MATSKILASLFRFAGKANRSCKPSAPVAEYLTLKRLLPFFDASPSPASFSSTTTRYAKSNIFTAFSRSSVSDDQLLKPGIADDTSTVHSEDINSKELYDVYRRFNEIRKVGFMFDEDTYGPFLTDLIDRRLVHEFYLYCDIMSDGNLFSFPRLGYYEMLLWIQVNDEEMIQSCCNFIANDDKEDTIKSRENYLLALCECDREYELVTLLKILDLRPFSILADIFKSLGRLSLGPLAEKLLLDLKAYDKMQDHISDLIFSYSTSIMNLKVVDALGEFQRLHASLDVAPSWLSYEKFISHCCDLDECWLAIEILREMGKKGFCCSINTIHRIEQLCKSGSELDMLWRAVRFCICADHTRGDAESVRRMLNTCLHYKDFSTALHILRQQLGEGIEKQQGVMTDESSASEEPVKGTFNACCGV